MNHDSAIYNDTWAEAQVPQDSCEIDFSGPCIVKVIARTQVNIRGN